MFLLTKEFVGGALLTSCGVAYTSYALIRYPIGSLAEMGPGMFPVMAGAVLSVLGAAVVVNALNQPGTPVNVDWGPLSYVIAGLVVFALLLRPFGFVPAIAAMTATVTVWNRSTSNRAKLILVVLLPVMAYAIFYVGLNVRMTPFRMPF